MKNSEKLVAQIVRKMVENEDDQKDIVQDIYLKVYQNLSKFKFQSKLSTWIATIAYNTTISFLKKKKIPLIDYDRVKEIDFNKGENMEVEIIKSETTQIIRNELKQLPPLYKTLISLYHLEALPYKDIVQITQLPEGTIKSYLYRARKMLKEQLERNSKQDSYE